MGLLIEGGQKELSANNHNRWEEAYSLVSNQAQRMGIRHALAGSLSFRILTGKDTIPHDMDILLMCPPDDRYKFADEIAKKWHVELPNLDLCELFYYGKLVFDKQAKATLVKGTLQVPIDESVFKTYLATFGSVTPEIPHPATYIELMRRSPSTPKTRRGINMLSEAIINGSADELPTPNLESFEQFEKQLRRNPIWLLRRKLDMMETDGDQHPAIKLKRYVREHHPVIARLLRTCLP